jgi:hypothetical protein
MVLTDFRIRSVAAARGQPTSLNGLLADCKGAIFGVNARSFAVWRRSFGTVVQRFVRQYGAKEPEQACI